MQDNENAPKLQGKGGAGRGQGRKAKSGKFIQFRPSQNVLDILANQKNMTKFIESAIIHYNNKIQDTIIEADNALNEF